MIGPGKRRLSVLGFLKYKKEKLLSPAGNLFY